MSNRESNLLWMKDVIEHLSACQQQLEWSEDAETAQVLIDAMLRDLDCCRRLCEAFEKPTGLGGSQWPLPLLQTSIIWPATGCPAGSRTCPAR